MSVTSEADRLDECRRRQAHWKRWGPYLAERAWGTVREDYSPDGTAWSYFPHEHARSRAYRWNEDGLAGICDRHQIVCFALALWNERDPILKERIFGLTGDEGNHGEDVKEYFYYVDSTPTHSYMRYLYKYPQRAFPYGELLEENRRRDRTVPEFELVHTGIFDDGRYFDVWVEYAKADVEDICIRITVENRGNDPAPLHVLPTVWFRNTWSWNGTSERPSLTAVETGPDGTSTVQLLTREYGARWLHAADSPSWLFTDNDTNASRVFGVPSAAGYFKDGVNDYVVHGRTESINPQRTGTKAAAHFKLMVPASGRVTLKLRLTDKPPGTWKPFHAFDQTLKTRIREADDFYSTIVPSALSADGKLVMRQALGGLLWSKQFYHYVVKDWLRGDPAQPRPPEARWSGRNREWVQLYNADVISVPDKWEYPWYASWDLAFHCVALAIVDSDLAKEQLSLLLREWYMHPNGQLPAYEWAFSDVNPPVHAWAVWRVYKIEKKRRGRGDRKFLERCFHKLLLNFTWWVNRKDQEGNNVFQGGFLGLDNIGVFDRSKPLPTGGYLEQSDGTSWMAMYSLNLLAIALELAHDNSSYEDVASKFWEHFLYIASAMSREGRELDLWDEEDGFFYDVLKVPGHGRWFLKIRSMVGLIPLFAVETLEPDILERLPGFTRRLQWFVHNRPDLTHHAAPMGVPGHCDRRLLSIVDKNQLRAALRVMLDESEFLSPCGVRALSRRHLAHPYRLRLEGTEHAVSYDPGDSSTTIFGGNSNWRGPIWFPVNYLLIEALQKFHHYYGDDFTVECPTGSGTFLSLADVAAELSRRLTRIFLKGSDGRRAVFGETELFQRDPHWRDLIPFHEYFHGDTGTGLGASHQTGWTGLVAKLLQQSGD